MDVVYLLCVVNASFYFDVHDTIKCMDFSRLLVQPSCHLARQWLDVLFVVAIE